MLYRLVLCDMPEPPDVTSDTLLLGPGGRAAPPPGAGAARVHDRASRRAVCRDAALGLALCAYLFYTTSFIVSFHLEQTQGNETIADKRVYVVARRPHLKRLL